MLRGFSPQNIWRMKQFYEIYYDNEKLSPLVREIPWTNSLLVMSGCKSDKARDFYLETYKDDEIVTPLVTQISWTNNLLIMSCCKTIENDGYKIECGNADTGCKAVL